MFNLNKYKVTEMEYPTKQDIVDEVNKLIQQVSQDLPHREYATIIKELNDSIPQRLKEARQKYAELEGQKRELFRNDMEEEFELSRFPLTIISLIHAKAYENGHSSGYSEIRNCYYDIIEFVEQIVEGLQS